MKRFLVIIPVLLYFLFFSCKKAPGPADGDSVQLNNKLDSTVSFTASINQVPWRADSAYGYYASGVDSPLINLMITAAKKNNGNPSSMVFYITNYTGPNTYNIVPPGISATYYVGNQQFFANKGQIIITADSPYATIGTFIFFADSDSITISGSFNVATP